MGWKAEARKTYEQRVVNDALARLAQRVDIKGLPLTDEELHTLAKRSREAFGNREKRAARLAGYQAHLARSYGKELIASLAAALENINNEIGYEEK